MKLSHLISVIILAIPGLSFAAVDYCPTPQQVLDTVDWAKAGGQNVSIGFGNIEPFTVDSGPFMISGIPEKLDVKFYNADYEPRGLDKGVIDECLYSFTYDVNGQMQQPELIKYRGNVLIANPTTGNWPSEDNVKKKCYGQNDVTACEFDTLY